MPQRSSMAISAFIIFVFLVVVASSSELHPGNGCFYVKEVQEDLRHSKYQLISTQGRGCVWIVDSVGRYNVGDTLCVHEYKKFSRDSK